MRLIDADALKKEVESIMSETMDMSFQIYAQGFCTTIDNAPTIDAVPREGYISMERTVARLQQGIADAVPKVDIEHDREWIIGCIKHDGFIKTDRGDKANQIILEALKADAVDVVRCKDCHWYKKPYCDMHNGEKFNDNDFCSYGERSEE